MLDSDTSDSIDYNEVYSLFTKNDLEDVLINTNKQSMTVKEECEAIEKLRSENFDLKIRFYLLNQDYKDLLAKQLNGNGLTNGLGSKQSSENGSVKNLNVRKESSIKDKEIKVLRTVLEQRVKQLSSLKSYYEDIIRSKDSELEDLKMEKTSAYVTELECNAAALYKIVEQKDSESVELRETIENQKNEIRRLKGELKSMASQLQSNQQINKELSEELANNQRTNDKTLTTDTYKLSLEQTRKELDKLKFEMRNQKIIEKEKLDNFAKLLTEREVENELLKDQIASLKERENYLQKETELLQKDNDLLKESEEQLFGEIKQLQTKEECLLKENREYETRIKEDYLAKKKQHLLKEKNHQFAKADSPRGRDHLMDENSNLINGSHPAKNSVNVQELIKYVKSLEERLDFQEEIMRKSDHEKEQLIVTCNSLKEKKNNLEKIISKQLEKTNNLLKTARMNFHE